MMWTASAATSAGPDHAPDGERRAELVAPLFEPVAEQRRRERRVDEAGGDQVDPDRRELERQIGRQGAEGGGGGRDDAEPDARAAAAGAAHEDQRAPGADLRRGVARDAEHQQRMVLERATRGLEVHLGQRRVVGPAGGDHDVVDRPLEAGEEGLHGSRIVRVERRRADCTELGCRALQPVGVAAGQDHVGALGSCALGRLEPDAGATADHDDDLPGQVRHPLPSLSSPWADPRRPACAPPRCSRAAP